MSLLRITAGILHIPTGRGGFLLKGVHPRLVRAQMCRAAGTESVVPLARQLGHDMSLTMTATPTRASLRGRGVIRERGTAGSSRLLPVSERSKTTDWAAHRRRVDLYWDADDLGGIILGL